MNAILFNLMIICHRLVRGLANRILDKRFIRPRNFSNAMLRKYAKHFSGSVINVSGWKDEDGEGGRYRDYFRKASSYTVSNVDGHKKGFGSVGTTYTEIELNLTKEIPTTLQNRFEVVFNHTTLEHMYDFPNAFRRLCALSNDVVIVVVPVLQQIHNTADFGDYWRPTTMALARLLLDNKFTPLVITCNDQPFAPVYCFAIGSRNPERYADAFPEAINFEMGAYNYGSSIKKESVRDLLR